MALAASMADVQQQAPGAATPPAALAAGGADPAASQRADPEPPLLRLVDVPEEPPESAEGCLAVALRLPDGQRVSRRFLAAATVGQLAAYAAQQAGGRRVAVAAQFPKRTLSDMDATLAAAGVEDRSMLTVTLL
jgi:hypothetical protein